MESFFRNTVDLQNMYNNSTNSLTTGGDAHYFEDLITPSKIKQYLDSTQVQMIFIDLVEKRFY